MAAAEAEGAELTPSGGEEEGMELAIARPTTYEGMLNLSKAHRAKGQLTEATEAAEEALAMAREAEDSNGQVSALCALAQTQSRSGLSALALDTAREMRTLCHRVRSVEGEAQALVEIARAHLFQHEAKPAIRAASAAAKLCARRGEASAEVLLTALTAVTEGSIQLLSDFASAPIVDSRLQKEIDATAAKALTASTQAMAIADDVDDFILRAQAFHWRSRALLIFSGKEQAALEAGSKARFLFQKAKEELHEAEALLALAQAYNKIEAQSKWASNALHDALEIFHRLNDGPGKDRAYALFQELGIALRVAGGVAAALPAAPADGGAAPAAPAAAASEVAVQPKGLDSEMVMSAVQEMAKAAIGLDEALYLDSPLMDSGMDSLTAVSFRNSLQQNLSVKLPSSLMFDYPTMKEVANRIVELSLEDS